MSVTGPRSPAPRVDPRLGEVLRVLDGYIALVEELDLCPWAAPARRAGAVRVEVIWDGDELEDRLVQAAQPWLTDDVMGVGLMVVPDLARGPEPWRHLRDRVAARLPRFAMAEFHPDAPFGADTPARLVRLLRRSPDPLLQLVPHHVLASLSRPAGIPTAAQQAAILRDPFSVPPAPPDPRDRIAQNNFETTLRVGVDVVERRLAELQDDRRAAYARVGIALPLLDGAR